MPMGMDLQMLSPPMGVDLNGSWVEQSQTMIQNSNYYSTGYIGGCYALAGSSQWKNYQLNVDLR